MVTGKTFSHRPINELFSIVKSDLRRFDTEGLIDEGNLIKTIMYCNEKLGLYVRDVKQAAIKVVNGVAELPLDFEKLYFVCGLTATNTVSSTIVNYLDNNIDSDIVYEASLDRGSLGNVDHYNVTVKRLSNTIVYNYGSWIRLGVDTSSSPNCHSNCPNKMLKGVYSVTVKEDKIEVPFKSGMLYIMYIGLMKDIEGNILYPFHPLITPYYEWMLKEKIITDAIFNSDTPNLGDLLKLTQFERSKAWLDAFNFSSDNEFGSYANKQRDKEMKWYNQYFKDLM